VFDERDVTEKSEGQASELKKEADNDYESENSSVKISQLFTRNKSLKLILGKN